MRSGIVIVLTSLLVLASSVAAQPPAAPLPAPPPASGCPPNCPLEDWEKMGANIEYLRVLKLLEAVDLSKEQSDRFLPLFHAFRQDAKSLHEQRQQLIDTLRLQVNREDTDTEIKATMERLAKNRLDADLRLAQFLSDCGPILTIRQQARLLIFQERFEREVLESLREFRQMRGHEPGKKP